MAPILRAACTGRQAGARRPRYRGSQTGRRSGPLIIQTTTRGRQMTNPEHPGEEAIEQDLERTEQAADERAADEVAAAESERRAEETVTERTDKLAEAERRAQNREALELQHEARQAETRAEALDPKENR